MSFLFPAFECFLASGLRVEKTSYPGSSLSFQAGYGQTVAYSLTIQGEQARQLEENGLLTEGSVALEIKCGYRTDELITVAKNLVCWDADYSSDSTSGDSLTVTFYGCSQLLRQSGQRTERLAAKTYADAAKEIADRWGLKIKIGKSANKEIDPNSSLFDNNTTDSITFSPGPPNTAVIGAAMQVVNGFRIPSLTDDTVTQPAWCAQLVRQVVEYGLGLDKGKWDVAIEAQRIAPNDGDSVQARTANNYATACRNLGYAYQGGMQPGDIIFNETTAPPFGHTAIFLGDIAGVPSVLENASSDRGIAPLGSGRIRVTPLAQLGNITTVSRATALPDSEKPPTETPDAASGLASENVTAQPVVDTAVNQNRRSIFQENESDFAFLEKLGREIGYVLTESALGDELVFGPGLEVGTRERYLLVRGTYAVNGRTLPANIYSLRSKRTLYGIPSEIVVTGFEDGERFALLVTPEDLADRNKVKEASAPVFGPQPNTVTTFTTEPSSDAASGLATEGVTAEPVIDTPAATPKATKENTQGSADYASRRVGELVSGAYPVGKRQVLGGSSSKLDALERGLEALALSQLRYQEVEVETFGIPGIKTGQEVLLMGSLVPKTLQGLYLISSVGGEISGSNGYGMNLTLNRNTAR